MEKRHLLFAIIIFCATGFAHAQTTSYGFGAGAAGVVGSNEKYFNFGFNLNFEYFSYLTPVTSVGCRLAFNRLGVNEEELLKEYPGFNFRGGDPKSSYNIYEITPSFRFATPGSGAQFFVQLGGGVYLARAKSKLDFATKLETDSALGWHAGVGMLSGNESVKLALYPMFNSISSSTGASKYLTLNLTLIFY